MPRPTVELEVEEVVRETEQALLCLIEGKEYWIPKSQIAEESDVAAEGDSGTLVIPEWLAVEKKLV